jgi:hypothetical protein
MSSVEFQAERWRRIKVHQEADDHLMNLKRFLKGEFDSFSHDQMKRFSKEAELFTLDARDVLYRMS